jgi:hypothetical protein
MAGRHDKPPSPHLFHPNLLLARYHATVSIIAKRQKKHAPSGTAQSAARFHAAQPDRARVGDIGGSRESPE